MANVYYQVIQVTDFGPYVTKLVLGMPREVSAEELTPEQFSVYVTVRKKNGDQVELPKSFIQRDEFVPSRGYRPVLAAYPSDLRGEKAEGPSCFVALEMPFGPLWKCSAALAADFKSINGHESYTVQDYRVSLTARGTSFSVRQEVRRISDTYSIAEPFRSILRTVDTIVVSIKDIFLYLFLGHHRKVIHLT